MIRITTPALIGSLLTDKNHLFITELVIVHSLNRYIAEPHVFCLAIIISRFALYYDFEMTSNMELNLLIGLLISKKFFSIVPLFSLRNKLKIYYSEFLSLYGEYPSFLKTLIMYLRMLIIPLNINFYFPFFWSLITGASINFVKLIYYFPMPSPPKSNIFWDFPKEKLSIKYKFV